MDPVQVGEATKYAQTVFTDKHAPSVLKLNHKQLLEDPLQEICQLAYKYPVQFLTINQFLEKKLPFFQSCSKVAFDSLMITLYHLLINYVSPELTNFPLLRGVPRKPCSCKSTCDNLLCQCRITAQSCLNLCYPENDSCLNCERELISENREENAILQKPKLLFSGFGGCIMQDHTQIKFQNTCTIDNWIALLRVIHIDHPIVFDEMLHVSSCLSPPLCKILALIKAAKFNEIKLDIARFNQIKSSGDVIDFYGR